MTCFYQHNIVLTPLGQVKNKNDSAQTFESNIEERWEEKKPSRITTGVVCFRKKVVLKMIIPDILKEEFLELVSDILSAFCLDDGFTFDFHILQTCFWG